MDFTKIPLEQSFSKRIGLNEDEKITQLSSMDTRLKTALWNVFKNHYDFGDTYLHYLSVEKSDFIKHLWSDHFGEDLDHLDNSFRSAYSDLKHKFSQLSWNKVYEFMEFVAKHGVENSKETFKKNCNAVLEKNLSAYRFVGNEIGQITDNNEISEINKALTNSLDFKFQGTKIHLESSIRMLFNRDEPDYRNSIKESILAVESICKFICNNEKATLGEAIKIIDQKIKVHSALKLAFEKLYGYTSGDGGIRHAMMEETNIGFEDAKYMLVSCSAFINYLVVKCGKAEISFK